LIALVGFGFVGASVSLGWATATRDDAGFFSTSSERFESDSFAITSDKTDLGDPGPDDWWADRELATVRVAVDSATAGELFVGIGPEAEVEAFLADVPHDEVTDVDFRPFSADYRRQNADGTAMPSPPMDETFWVAQAAGDATQTITWNLEPGNWVIVVMNADAVANVSADIELGGKLDYLVPIAIGLGVAGVVLLAAGAAMIIGGAVRRQVDEQAASGAGPGAVVPVDDRAFRPYPLRLEGHLDAELSRWRWLVKWLLAIPRRRARLPVDRLRGALRRGLSDPVHGSLPFDLRLQRRSAALDVAGQLLRQQRPGHRSLPPFTLDAAVRPPSTSTTSISRAASCWSSRGCWRSTPAHHRRVPRGPSERQRWHRVGAGRQAAQAARGGGGTALVHRALPTGLHDLIMGVNRWTYRVIAYVALMTDYPPFRLDQGGNDPLRDPTKGDRS
jgi:hypothetical protein